MSTPLTRRSLVAAAPVAALAASLPVLAASAQPDAGLLALRPLWREAEAAFEATFEPVRLTENLVRARVKAEPHVDRSTIELETGYTLADANQSRACYAEWDIAERVFSMPATTPDGVRFKIEVLNAFKDCHVPDYEVHSNATFSIWWGSAMLEPALVTRRVVAAAIPLALSASATAALPAPPATDPVLAQIERHKALVVRVNTHPGDDDSLGFQDAAEAEEAAIQALGVMTPTTLVGAAAQLTYRSKVATPTTIRRFAARC